jgi:hypothetical protein
MFFSLDKCHVNCTFLYIILEDPLLVRWARPGHLQNHHFLCFSNMSIWISASVVAYSNQRTTYAVLSARTTKMENSENLIVERILIWQIRRV